MKKIIRNTFQSPASSVLGGVAGLPQVITGAQSGDWVSTITGVAIFIWGLLTNEQGRK